MAGKRRFRRRARNGPTLAKRVSRLEKVAVPETKWQENIDIPASVTNNFCESNSLAPFDVSILDLDEGTGQHDRVGNQVKIKSFYSKFYLQAPTGANGRIFRFVLYNPRNLGSNTTDYHYLSNAINGNPLTIHDQIDADRFSVIFDKNYYIGPCNGGGANLKQITLARKFKNLITQQYNSALSGTHTKGDVRLYVVSSQQTASSNKSYLQGYMKTYFIDP